MNYEIRELRSGEANELKRLACRNFSVVEQLFMPKPRLGVVAQADNGSIAGAAFLIMIETGKEKVGCVDIIFVLPPYRGSGVARQLYHAAVKKLYQQECNTVMALVRGDNSKSLLCFEAEGLYPISLEGLRKCIGTFNMAGLFIKTAALACATGCWILCDKATIQSRGGNVRNLTRTFWINSILLLCGAGIGSLLHITSNPWWNLVAALFFLMVITLGETIGKKVAGGNWCFVMPEGGLIPSAIVALLGGFYPMLGHWYLKERKNTEQYHRRMAAPAKGAWLFLMVTTLMVGGLEKIHSFFSCARDLGIALLIMYMLPFYPFDTFGSRRIQEYNKRDYAVLLIFSMIILVWIICYR